MDKHKKKHPAGQEHPADETPAAEQAAQPQDARVQELEEALKAAEATRDEYLQMAQRVQADFDNFRRRNASVRSEAYDDGAADFIKSILPVMDNLERALQVDSSDMALCDGVRAVQKLFNEALEKRGVLTIDRVGEVFDPKYENAVIQGSPEEGEPGTVSQVMLKGYRLGEKVLRHAMVKVIAG